jgi:16S rRNA (uracil1498-N3)-methyltransferase
LSHRPVTLTGAQAHQVERVLRLRPADSVVLLDNTGMAYEATILAQRRAGVELAVVRSWPAAGEPGVFLTLFQAVIKGERFGWALQKGTEAGISRFVPLICERNVVEDRQAFAGKRARWERIIQEAAEQSGRGRLPELAECQRFGDALLDRRAALGGPAGQGSPVHVQGRPSAAASVILSGHASQPAPQGPEGAPASDEVPEGGESVSASPKGLPVSAPGTSGQEPGAFDVRKAEAGRPEDGAPAEDTTLRLIAWEAETSAGLRAALAGAALGPHARIDLFIGPEGGWAPEEVRLAQAHGVQPVSLGPRILRAETAGIVAAAAIFYAAGEMEPGAAAFPRRAVSESARRG